MTDGGKSQTSGNLGWLSIASLAVGGMVGGGIYVALGVVVEAAGHWAWLSFVIAGVVAVATAYAYARLSNHFGTGGGAFAFLEQMDRRGAAGSLSWVLLVAYTLTIALYAFAFGEYVAHAFGGGPVVARLLSIGILTGLTGLNLWGLGKLTGVEIAIVVANLAVLVVLAIVGLGEWSPNRLLPASGPKDIWAAWVGAAAIFVSYEGFQLVTYEYDELANPGKNLVPVLVGSAIVVVVIYAIVAVGATMIAGADTVIEKRSVALSVAAEEAFGTVGLVGMTMAAAFATSAAITSTLFSSAKLASRVAADGELPAFLDHRNDRHIPDRAVLSIASTAALLSVIGSLSALVEAASLAFLVAFGGVNVIAWREGAGKKWICGAALGIGGAVGGVLIYRLATTKAVPLAVILCLFLVSFFLRPRLLEQVDTESTRGSRE